MSFADLQFPECKSQIITGLNARNIIREEDGRYSCKLWGVDKSVCIKYPGLDHSFFSDYLLTPDELAYYKNKPENESTTDKFVRDFQLCIIDDAVDKRRALIRCGIETGPIALAQELLGKKMGHMTDEEVDLCIAVRDKHPYSSAWINEDRVYLIYKKYKLY